ncbi:MAG: hypothetical protein LBU16_00805 [Treponema sp.]|nr:hypothetical protein [Treponema sp.]
MGATERWRRCDGHNTYQNGNPQTQPQDRLEAVLGEFGLMDDLKDQ